MTQFHHSAIQLVGTPALFELARLCEDAGSADYGVDVTHYDEDLLLKLSHAGLCSRPIKFLVGLRVATVCAPTKAGMQVCSGSRPTPTDVWKANWTVEVPLTTALKIAFDGKLHVTTTQDVLGTTPFGLAVVEVWATGDER